MLRTCLVLLLTACCASAAPTDRAWPDDMERELQARRDRIVQQFKNPKSYGGTFFENEKQSYPNALFDYLAGNKERALKFLQSEDADAQRWHAHTQGIDFFACFTLKGQTRKYFLLRDELDPAYRQRMFDGAKAWTEQDPVGRPHPAYKGPSQTENWTPEAKNSWVDGRSTDNLKFMRDTSVYLFAEETGNEATRLLYKEKLRSHVRAMYDVGMGEWDSENYLGHSLAPWLNVYDFAKDDQTRQLARGALDWISTAAALKYYRGGFNGPCKRDYVHLQTWQVPAARLFGYYFADRAEDPPDPERDVVHLATSRYRPPLAVMALARKQFDRPVELLLAHPPYPGYNSQPSSKVDQPRHYETQYIGTTFMLGTLPTGHLSDSSVPDVNGFKLLARNEKRGVDQFIVGTGATATRINVTTNGRDQLAHCRNAVIWLNDYPAAEFHFFLPKSATIEKSKSGVVFIALESTWLALHPIHLGGLALNDAVNKELAEKQKLTEDHLFTAKATGDKYAGFVLEVGEGMSLEEFKQSVERSSKLDLQSLDKGVVNYTGVSGQRAGIRYEPDGKPTVLRDDVVHEWSTHQDPCRSLGAPIVAQKWKSGRLRVEAGGHVFEGRINDAGNYESSEK